MYWTTCGLNLTRFSLPETPQKMFFSENVIFWALRLSLGYFGRQASENPLSELQIGVSISSLLIVDLLTF